MLKPIQNGSFRSCSRMGRGNPLLKISHTYPTTMMKLNTVISYLKKFQKYVIHVTLPLSSTEISTFVISGNFIT